MSRIVTILPKGEGFSDSQFGAIALCVRDFTASSRYRDETLVIGGTTPAGFAKLRYTMPRRARWFENRTRAYANGCAGIINEAKAELTEVHNRPYLLRLIAGKSSCKLALHLHNDPQEMEEARTPPERVKLLSRCEGVYCVSNYIRDRFLEGLPKSAEEKLFLTYNGIAIPESLPPKENTIVFAGRMTEGKGALLLAEALRIALPQLSNWRALLIGSRRHEAGRALDPHEKEIAQMLEPLLDQVTITGFLSHEQTLAHFARSHIAVIPSLWAEPFGRTALEAMAYGCAVISSGTGGLPEVTADAALTLQKTNAEMLSHAILSLAQDEALRSSYQRLARERALYFSIASRTQALDDARDTILQKRTHHVA